MVLADCWVICLESNIGGPAMTLVAPWRLLYRVLPAPLAQRARQRLPPGGARTRFKLPGGEAVALDNLSAAESQRDSRPNVAVDKIELDARVLLLLLL